MDQNLAGRKAVWHYAGQTYRGKKVDPGQIITVKGDDDDEPLHRLEWFTLLPAKAKTFRCGACQEDFVSERLRARHGDLRHPDRFERKPETVDEIEAAELGERDRVAQAVEEKPIRFDRTKATLEASPA